MDGADRSAAARPAGAGEGCLREALYTPDRLQKLGWRIWGLMVSDLVGSRALVRRLFVRDLRARYRQSWLGYVWAVLPQLVVVFAFWKLSGIRGLATMRETPYHYVAYASWSMGVWLLFLGCYNAAAGALAGGGALVSKINFAKEALVVAAMGQAAFDFCVRLIPVAVVFGALRIVPCWEAVFLPVVLLPLLLLAAGLGMIMAITNTMASDFGSLVGLLLGLGMFAAPVLYGPPRQWPLVLLNIYNPVSAVLIATHDLIVCGRLSAPGPYVMAWLLAVLVFGVGWRFFRLAMPRVAERL